MATDNTQELLEEAGADGKFTAEELRTLGKAGIAKKKVQSYMDSKNITMGGDDANNVWNNNYDNLVGEADKAAEQRVEDQKKADLAAEPQVVTPGGNVPESEFNKTTNQTSRGLFNFKDLMADFYNYSPGKNDDEGRALKNAFQTNLIQSVYDTQNAKGLAYANQEIASNAMNQAADLEQRNMAQVMKDEYIYGMNKMGSEYDYQSRFAVDESNRELNRMAMGGDIQQNQTMLESQENRLNMETAGVVDIAKARVAGEEERETRLTQGAIDTSTMGTQGLQSRLNMGAEGQQQRLTMKTSGSEDRKLQLGTDTRTEEQKKPGENFKENKSYSDDGVISATGQEERKTITRAAEEGREDMNLANRLEAKTRASESKYARGLANKF